VDSFIQCNPSVPGPGASRSDSGLPIVFESNKCRSEQAALISVMLKNEKYSYGAIVPQPYTYPAHVLETLLALDFHQQKEALDHLAVLARKLGKLGTLVKTFAWGIPVTMQELSEAIGGSSDVLTALQDCGIVISCDTYPHVVRSAVQLFPVEQPSIIVATDWQLPQDSPPEDVAEKRIQAVDIHDIFLILNTPSFSQLGQTKILNMASASGVIGLAAADRGASVVLLDSNPRSADFGRFNSWLNLLSHRVRVALADFDFGGDSAFRDFSLILSHPMRERVDMTIRAALEATRHSDGMTIIAFENEICEGFTERYNSEFCGDAEKAHADLTGSVVCRNPHGHAYDSEVTSREGMVFVWKGAVEDVKSKKLEEMDKCGHFQTRHLKSFIGNVGVPACKFGRGDMLCPEAADLQAA